MKKKLLVITGPTATGKTDVALKLAQKFNGELISADSRQVYTGLDIGTGKLSSNDQVSKASLRVSKASLRVKIKKGKGFWEIEGIKIWAYDLVNSQVQYSVADYIEDAKKYIDDIVARDKLPILVGGTYFYIKSLLDGLANLSKPIDLDLRKKLANYSLDQLQQELKKLSPQKWRKLNESDKQNSRRLLRAIELVHMNPYKDNNETTSRGFFEPTKKWRGLKNDFDILKIGLIAPREILYKNADKRVLTRISQGMIEETKELHKNGLTFKRMKELGLEYQVLADYLQGKIIELAGINGFTRREAMLIKILQDKIHGFIRRQLTWFKKDIDIKWFDITQKSFGDNLEKTVTSWYDPPIKSYAKKN